MGCIQLRFRVADQAEAHALRAHAERSLHQCLSGRVDVLGDEGWESEKKQRCTDARGMAALKGAIDHTKETLPPRPAHIEHSTGHDVPPTTAEPLKHRPKASPKVESSPKAKAEKKAQEVVQLSSNPRDWQDKVSCCVWCCEQSISMIMQAPHFTAVK